MSHPAWMTFTKKTHLYLHIFAIKYHHTKSSICSALKYVRIEDIMGIPRPSLLQRKGLGTCNTTVCSSMPYNRPCAVTSSNTEIYGNIRRIRHFEWQDTIQYSVVESIICCVLSNASRKSMNLNSLVVPNWN